MSRVAQAIGVVTGLGPTTGVVALPLHGASAEVVDGAAPATNASAPGDADADPNPADPPPAALRPETPPAALLAIAQHAAREAGHPAPDTVRLTRWPAPALGDAVAAAAAGARLGLLAADGGTGDAPLVTDHDPDAPFARGLRAACAALQAAPGDPRPHAVAAALTGRPHAVTHRYPPRVVALAPSTWWLAVVTPAIDAPARGWSQHGPRTVDTRKAIAGARALAGWLDAWARGDGDALLACSDDRIYDHAVLPRIPGAHPARHAALGAGALTAGLTLGGPALAAVARHEADAVRIADAMAAAWAAHRIESTSTVCPVTP